MNKIEKIYRLLLNREKEISSAIMIRRNWLKEMNVNHELHKVDETLEYLKGQAFELDYMIKQYRFIYQSELEVIDGYCIEFKVR